MKHRYLKNVASLLFAADRCIGCGMCVNVCPHNVFELDAKKARIADKDACMECGACEKNCPTAAIEVSAGVGCASAIIKSWVTGGEPTCGCSGEGCC